MSGMLPKLCPKHMVVTGMIDFCWSQTLNTFLTTAPDFSLAFLEWCQVSIQSRDVGHDCKAERLHFVQVAKTDSYKARRQTPKPRWGRVWVFLRIFPFWPHGVFMLFCMVVCAYLSLRLQTKTSKRSPLFRPHFFSGFLDGSKAFTDDIQFFVHWCGAWFVVHRPKPVVLHGIFTWSSKVANGWKLHQMSTEAAKIHPTIHRMRTINMEDRPKKSIFISWIFPSKHTLCAFLLQLLLLFSHFHAFLSGKLGAGTTLSNIPTQHTSPQLALPETNSESPWKIVGKWLSF